MAGATAQHGTEAIGDVAGPPLTVHGRPRNGQEARRFAAECARSANIPNQAHFHTLRPEPWALPTVRAEVC